MVSRDRIGLGARQGEEAETQGGGVLGGMEVLQCYNPHRTEGFCTIGVLQRCYRGATGVLRTVAGRRGNRRDFNHRERKEHGDFNRKEREERRETRRGFAGRLL